MSLPKQSTCASEYHLQAERILLGVFNKFTFGHHIKICPLVADLCVPLISFSLIYISHSLLFNMPLCALRFIISITVITVTDYCIC